jgi:hypothetical protein
MLTGMLLAEIGLPRLRPAQLWRRSSASAILDHPEHAKFDLSSLRVGLYAFAPIATRCIRRPSSSGRMGVAGASSITGDVDAGQRDRVPNVPKFSRAELAASVPMSSRDRLRRKCSCCLTYLRSAS